MSEFSRIVRLSRELKKWRGCGFPPWGDSARGFWDPSSHLVEYSYLDCLADTIQVRKTFSFGRTGAAFLRGKRGEGRREEEMKEHGYMVRFVEQVRHRGWGSAQDAWRGITYED